MQEIAPVTQPSLDDAALCCPDCGSTLRLALVPSTEQPAPVREAPISLHSAPQPESLPDFEGSVRDYKRDLIVRALADNNGVMTRAAKALGLKYTTFVAMVHRLEILNPEGEPLSDNG